MKTYIFCLLLLLTACTSLPKGSMKKRYARFGVDIPQGWQQKSFRAADLFFEHSSAEAGIFIQAECDKISDSPLEVMTSQLLVGFSDVNYIKQEHINLAERQALISELTARIDGVERYLKIMILRKNRCLFDAVFNSAPRAAPLLVHDFDKLIHSLWAEVEL